MTIYEQKITQAESKGLEVKEKNLLSDADALIIGKKIAINKNKKMTECEKAWATTEEIGHFETSVGDIIDITDTENCKQERQARLWTYNDRIGLLGIIKAAQHHCAGSFEIAEYLDVPEERLIEAVEEYRGVYGRSIAVDNYMIRFEPALEVYEYFIVK